MLLAIHNLSAGYADRPVISDISLELAIGEAVAIIGPNGAGKSTVLKSIMNLTTKTGGRIVWKERDVTNLPTHTLLEEGISFVPQGRLVFPSLTVLENLEMGGYLIQDRSVLEKNIAAALSFFPQLKQHLKALAGSLSGGEQQMLAIARALVTTPALLILDEPSLGLSPKIVHEVFEQLKVIQAAGTTLLIVEQNVRVVLQYVSRGYLLVNGQLRFSGSAAELGSDELMQKAYLS